MRIWTRVLSSLALLTSVLVAGIATAPDPALALKAKQSLARTSSDTSTCTYSSARQLSAIQVAGPLVHEQLKWARRGERQYIRYTPALQGLTATGAWANVPGKAIQRVIRLNTWNAHTWRQLKTVTMSIPTGFKASAFRVTATVRWYGSSQRPAAKRTLLLTSYDGGQTSCLATRSAPAPKPAPGSQSLAVSPSAAVVATGQAFSGAFTATGVTGSETITKTLYGPQASPAGCSGPVARQTSTTISASGTYPIEAVAESVSGYYFWGISAAGNSSLTAASACASASVAVRKQISVAVGNGNRYMTAPITATVAISGFDRQMTGTWTGVLWGPFDTIAAATCSGDKHSTLVAHAPISPAAGATYSTTLSKSLSKVAYWRWQATFDTNGLETGTTTCSPVFHTLKTAP